MKDFILELRFDATDTQLEDLIQSRLFLAGSTGSNSGDWGMDAWFDTPAARAEAAEALAELEGLEISLTERERVDWLDLYKQSLEPMEIGQKFIVAPDASLIPAESRRLALVIPQEQAFGTGSHETTWLCIEHLEAMDLAGRRGLDVGAGSGILALAMLRLGAAKAIAFDNDPDAYAALHENRGRNGVYPESMPIFIGGYESLVRGAFDVVTMNIIPEVIKPALPFVVQRLADDARLVVSGVLLVRADEIIEEARSHALELVDQRQKGEWWAGVFRPRG